MNTCPIHKKCAGCQLWNLPYKEQLSLKQAKIIRLVGKYCHANEIIGMEDPLHYRNKASHIFGFRGGKIISGIYQSATGRIVETDSCFLETEESGKIIKSIQELLQKFRIKAYDLHSGLGFFRHVLVRTAKATGEIMIVLVTAEGQFPSKNDFVNALLKKHSSITTIVWNINPTDTPLLLGKKSEILYGPGYITDALCGLHFRISPRSFYQVNRTQTEILYKTAAEFASLSGKERIIDAYCGTGTIGLTMASRAREVIGVESNADAVADAKKNATLNHIKNASFIVADAGKFMEELAQAGESVDVVIADPPRAGCSKQFLSSLLTLSSEKIVYISCNPETLSRDLFALRKGGYKIIKIQPVDMFPFTEHVETVVLLNRKKSREDSL